MILELFLTKLQHFPKALPYFGVEALQRAKRLRDNGSRASGDDMNVTLAEKQAVKKSSIKFISLWSFLV